MERIYNVTHQTLKSLNEEIVAITPLFLRFRDNEIVFDNVFFQ